MGESSSLWQRLWAPRRLDWWIAMLFMAGSALFALGGAKATWPELPALRWLDQQTVGWVFFIGSLFFTSAGYLQWVATLPHDASHVAAAIRSPWWQWHRLGWRLLGWRPRHLDRLAAAVQLVGTLLFNLNTADALVTGLDWAGEDLLVWTPDVVGSICFLVASRLALVAITHRAWSFRPRSLAWWIAAINLLGSVLFMVSAVASLMAPAGILAPWLANFGTFAGAVCFLVGAFLSIPDLFRPAGPGDP